VAVTSPPALAPAPSAVGRPGTALGGTVWLAGLPSAGKTTVAQDLLAERGLA
jgi:adenylylsulfate kinase-like enzyme